jgi:hypothetical protein
MMTTRRPFLSLFFCLALAVNLLAPFASATPLFTEICIGHGIVLVPSENAPEPEICEMCPVSCATALTPEGWIAGKVDTRPAAYGERNLAQEHFRFLPEFNARAPPSTSC